MLRVPNKSAFALAALSTALITSLAASERSDADQNPFGMGNVDTDYSVNGTADGALPELMCGASMKPDIEKMEFAAETGDASAAFRMGQLCAHGLWGLPKDEVAAVKWYRLAAERGYRAAKVKLALAYELGRGITENPREAAKWYRSALRQAADPQLQLKVKTLSGNSSN